MPKHGSLMNISLVSIVSGSIFNTDIKNDIDIPNVKVISDQALVVVNLISIR